MPWQSVALGTVLSLSVAAPTAQYLPHVGLSIQDQDALAAHRLTVDNVGKMFAVDREFVQLLKTVPDLDARAAELEKSFDVERVGIIAVGPKVYEALPETAQVLQRRNISARDYLLTKILAMIVEIQDGALASGVFQREGLGEDSFTTPALKFWRAMDPGLKAQAARWQGTRREMEKYGRLKVW